MIAFGTKSFIIFIQNVTMVKMNTSTCILLLGEG